MYSVELLVSLRIVIAVGQSPLIVLGVVVDGVYVVSGVAFFCGLATDAGKLSRSRIQWPFVCVPASPFPFIPLVTLHR